MTRDEFIKKYGEVEVYFSSYYKYCFSFKSKDGKIGVSIGGSGDDIYSIEVDADRPVLVRDLYPDNANVNGKCYSWGW